jgi:tetratricopeptide (TPR) repeat protein
LKGKLLGSLEEARAREAELEALVVDEPADPDGRWHAKDHLAHVSWWRARSARTLDAARTGQELPPPTAEDDDVQNAIIYAEVRDRSARDVKTAAHESWEALRRAIEASSEDDLAKPNPRESGSQIWEIVPGVYGHVGTHVWSWYLDVGEVDRAMDVARWAFDVEGGFFSRPEQRAISRYNLACVYARLGNAEEALPLLRETFSARPSLKEWAAKDHDLDSIRDDPGLKELLAT